MPVRCITVQFIWLTANFLLGRKYNPRYGGPGSGRYRISTQYTAAPTLLSTPISIPVLATCRRDKKLRRSRSRETKSRGRDSKSQESDDRAVSGEGKVRYGSNPACSYTCTGTLFLLFLTKK